MILLWASLFLLTLFAMGFVLKPCIGQQQGKGIALVLFISLPIAGLLLYWYFGASQSLMDAQVYSNQFDKINNEINESGTSVTAIHQLENAIAQRAKDGHEDANAWYLLGKLYLGAGQEEKAAEALYKAAQLAVNQAEKFEPQLLSLLAALAFQKGDTQTALALWQKVLHSLDPESTEAQGLRQMISKFNSAR